MNVTEGRDTTGEQERVHTAYSLVKGTHAGRAKDRLTPTVDRVHRYRLHVGSTQRCVTLVTLVTRSSKRRLDAKNR